MNIGMVVDNEWDGDVRVNNEARTLVEAGHCVFVLCLAKNERPQQEEQQGVMVNRIRHDKKWRNRTFFFAHLIPVFHTVWTQELVRFITHNKIEILHAHDLYMARSAQKAAKKCGVKWVLDLHENFPEAVKGYRWAMKWPNRIFTLPHRWIAFEKKYLPQADNLVVLSDSFRQELVQRYPTKAEKDFVVYANVPDVEELLQYPVKENIIADKGDAKVLFYFGGIAARRGVFTLIEAHYRLLADGFNVKLLLIGPVDKAEKAAFDAAIAPGLQQNSIVYHAWIEMEELPSFLKAADICYSPIVKNPQHESGIANKVFQYMLFECPVIVSDCKPQQRVVEEAGCGLTFRSEDVDDLIRKTKTLLQDENAATKMGKKGKKVVLEKHNRKAMGKNLINLYDQLQKEVG